MLTVQAVQIAVQPGVYKSASQPAPAKNGPKGIRVVRSVLLDTIPTQTTRVPARAATTKIFRPPLFGATPYIARMVG